MGAVCSTEAISGDMAAPAEGAASIVARVSAAVRRFVCVALAFFEHCQIRVALVSDRSYDTVGTAATVDFRGSAGGDLEGSLTYHSTHVVCYYLQ